MIKYKLLSEKENRMGFVFLMFFVFMVLVVILVFKVDVYDSTVAVGIISCSDSCKIEVTMPFDKIDSFNNEPFISYNNKSYDILNISYGEPYLNGEIALEDVVIETNLESQDKLINFKILSNKQRIIEKIKNIILER